MFLSGCRPLARGFDPNFGNCPVRDCSEFKKRSHRFAVADGRLITGQNPESGGAVAELVIKELKKPN